MRAVTPRGALIPTTSGSLLVGTACCTSAVAWFATVTTKPHGASASRHLRLDAAPLSSGPDFEAGSAGTEEAACRAGRGSRPTGVTGSVIGTGA